MMADQWDEYLKRQQPTGGGSSFGSLKPNKQGMYTPNLSMPQPGPATPINYGAIRNLLNSGVLRTGQVAQPQPMPAVQPEPAPAPQQAAHPLSRLFSLFGGLR